MTDRALPVRLHRRTLGVLTDGPDGRPVMQWDNASGLRLNSEVLSRRLRFGVTDSAAAISFFGGLLPEGVHLDRLARHAKTTTTDIVGMLAEVGADLAGALRVGPERTAGDPVALSRAEVRELLREAPGFLVGGGGSALPGFQRKLTLTRGDDGGWVRGNGQIASTHILKPVAADIRSAVESEAYALAVTRAVGLTTFDSWVEELDDLAVLVVERYDRLRTPSGTIDRLHQEDLAQALGLPPAGNHKFERYEPRASLRAVASLLDDKATIFAPGTDRERLLRYVTANIALGNTDAHAKNFSLLHDESGGTRLAPLYDVAPLALGFDEGDLLAMYVNSRRHQADITVDDIVSEAESWGVAAGTARDVVEATLDSMVEATRTLPAHPSIERHVPGYIRQQAKNLLDGAPARVVSAIPPILLPRLGTPAPRAPRGIPTGGQFVDRDPPDADVELGGEPGRT